MLLQEAPDYGKTWLVVPVLVRVATRDFKLDWEAQTAKWYKPADVPGLNLMPGFQGVFDEVTKML